ncbi:unnamed protein product [Prorocentrum cordatum]|uniref:AAA+ ATPase domain-containing protein n=1 Tax=Prorocentrum cordatum TaxID=2364126 RepID=A0ABN9UD55_9DINO|nr:unnamed protein product [Polarella glacialis]
MAGAVADGVLVALAQSKMGRARRHGASRAAAALQEELALIGAALEAADGDDARAVLAEFWEEADEALAQASVSADPAIGDPRAVIGVQALAAPTATAAAAPPRPAGALGLAGRPGAGAEVRAALQAAVARGDRGWPADGCRESAAAPPAASQGPPAPRAPLPTPCRGAQAPAEGGAPAAGCPAAAPRAGGFRPASELLPRAPPARPEECRPRVSMGDVSRSVCRGGGSDGGGPRPARAGGGGAEGRGRDWSDEWLRIADPDQLERIVPALEATIHRASGADAVSRADISGLEFVKSQIEEVLILPQLHPHLFASALTRPARGLLLFGPPGTGKTLLARWIASECGATFFNVNASSVLSKWIGEAEKTVKALFRLAAERQPSVIFIDEIDSLLSQRRDADNESSRRVKNEFLTSLEGAETSSQEKLLLVGATNMPWELDPAALRRLPKRLYVPLPGRGAREALLRRQLARHNVDSGLRGALREEDLADVAAPEARTAGYSGSDLQTLLQEVAMGPVREASAALLRRKRPRLEEGEPRGSGAEAARPRDIERRDFECAMRRVKPSFNSAEELKHREFNEEHGTCRGEDAMRDADSDGPQGDEG